MTSRSSSRSLLDRPGGDVLERLVARDRAPVLLLPERVAAARIVLAVIRVAAVALGVLDDLALAARGGAGRERLALDLEVVALLVGEPRDHLAREPVDLGAEVLGPLLAALDAVEALLPAAGQLGARQQVVAEHLDEADALLGRAQAAALALDVLGVDQPLDRGGARRRRADARVLHRLGGLVVVDELAGGLHGAQERALRVAARRLGALGERLGREAGDDLARRSGPAATARPPRRLFAGVSPSATGRGGRLDRLAVGGPPAGLDHHLAAASGRGARRSGSRPPCARSARPGGRRPGSGARPCRRCAARRG